VAADAAFESIKGPLFFAVESRLRKIHELNGFLPKLAGFVDFEAFRPDLAALGADTAKGKRINQAFAVLKFLYTLARYQTRT
jgi:hypothetical protein